ncbi:hypothetical protein FM112_16260 [Gulosibacter sp. 10]|nr:hypothetical protein FM112_16260 [Gulosibacter sp. 10]
MRGDGGGVLRHGCAPERSVFGRGDPVPGPIPDRGCWPRTRPALAWRRGAEPG